MPSTRALKTRIRSVTSTKQITKAMQLVAASKMRRAQETTKASAPYADAAGELLRRLAQQVATDNHPLFVRREIKRRLIIVIAADKGLAGAYNSNILKKYLELLQRDDERGIENLTIAVGRKAAQFATRLKDTEVIGTYEDLADRPSSVQLFQAMLDARASEHSMRMLAMKNATDNASDLVDDLRLAMNKARQGAITQELAEISGGVEAMND